MLNRDQEIDEKSSTWVLFFLFENEIGSVRSVLSLKEIEELRNESIPRKSLILAYPRERRERKENFVFW